LFNQQGAGKAWDKSSEFRGLNSSISPHITFAVASIFSTRFQDAAFWIPKVDAKIHPRISHLFAIMRESQLFPLLLADVEIRWHF
jgi:hypothetical protein